MWFLSQFEPQGKTALIVGASQGLGAVLAAKLYEKNCSVILVARREAKLKSQVEGIESLVKVDAQHTAKLSYIVCDAADYEACEAMWDELLNKRNQDPDFIFNCAGSSIPKLFTDLTKSDVKSGMPINYNTALYVIHTGVKAILKNKKSDTEFKKRTIVMFSSVASFFPFIGYSQYSPTKAAIQSLSIVLRQELRPYNFRVACVFPGNFMSEGFEEEQLTKPEITKQIEGPSAPIPGEKCADIILSSLNRGYDTITTDFIGWFLGCSVLGFLPRHWSILQIVVSFILLLIAPIVNIFINRDIDKYFEKRVKNEPEETPKTSTSSDSKVSTSINLPENN